MCFQSKLNLFITSKNILISILNLAQHTTPCGFNRVAGNYIETAIDNIKIYSAIFCLNSKDFI